jgi:hypothetical protein
METDATTGGEQSKPNSKPIFGSRDWLSTSFSAIAIVLSVLSFYFSTFYVSNNTHATIVSTLMNDEGTGQLQTLDFGVAISNSGNRPAIMGSIGFAIGDGPEKPDWAGSIPSSDIPILIPAKDLRLVRIRVPIREAVNSKISYAGRREIGPEQHLFLDFSTIDSRGNQTRFLTPSLLAVRVKDRQMRPGILLVGDVRYKPFDLTHKSRSSENRARALLGDLSAPAAPPE